MIKFIDYEYMTYVYVDFFKNINRHLLRRAPGIILRLDKNFSGNNYIGDIKQILQDMVTNLKKNPAVEFGNYTKENFNEIPSEQELKHIEDFAYKIRDSYAGKASSYDSQMDYRNAIFKELLNFLNTYPDKVE